MNENEHDLNPPKNDLRIGLDKIDSQGGNLLSSAPGGIDAQYAWRFEGGNGQGKVKLIDIEQGWIADHEFFQVHTLPSTGISDRRFEDHGTAVLGVIMMKNTQSGEIGITPAAKGYVVSSWRSNLTYDISNAIRYANSCLESGDIILLEEQVFGKEPQICYLPAETENDIYEAILDATQSGIIVIEPAGNGILVSGEGIDLNKIIREEKEIFNISGAQFRDSGAILVGASTSKPPFDRMHRSNFGSRINCFAWGEDIRTAGNFPGSSNGLKNRCTNSFCGTSGAAAIIAGISLAVQSIAEANYHTRLSPMQMRSILGDSRYGTHSAKGIQQDKMGVMPDLKKIIDYALPAYFGFPIKMKN